MEQKEDLKTEEKISFTTAFRKLGELVPTSYNPRKLSKDQYNDLKNSLEKFGLAELPVINLNTNQILAGHMRIRVLTDLYGKDYDIEVRIPNKQLDEKTCKEYLIRSNKSGGEWDWDVMANNFDVEELKDWGFQDYELSFYNEEEVEMDRDDLTKTMDSYLNGNIRQIVLYFKAEEYDEFIPRLDALLAKEGLEDYTALFKKLVENYENSQS